MKTYVHLLTAACVVSCGALALPAADSTPADRGDATTKTPAVTAKPAGITLPPGIAAKEFKAAAGVQHAIAGVSDDVLTKDGFGKVLGWLAEQDKNRLSDKKAMNVDDLNILIDKLNAMYKVKYGKDFKIDPKSLDNYVTIVTGEVTDPQLLIGKWPVDAATGVRGALDNTLDKLTDPGKSVDKHGKVTPSDADIAKNSLFGGAVKLEKGRKVALVHFPAGHNLPGVTASMISELTSWRFDIPNNITADQLHASLLKCLKDLSDRNDLPLDYMEAHREACHHVIAALYGIEAPILPAKAALDR